MLTGNPYVGVRGVREQARGRAEKEVTPGSGEEVSWLERCVRTSPLQQFWPFGTQLL